MRYTAHKFEGRLLIMANQNYDKGSSEEGKSKNYPQYGKKGKKPRIASTRSSVDLDSIRTNDISYWNKTSGFSNVSKFNWDLIVGNPRKVSATVIPNAATPKSAEVLNPAQVMALHFVLGPGWASNTNDGVNRALSQIMSHIRASLSTSNIGFETADLGIFFASTSSIACNIGFAKRVLECYDCWKDRNYVYPRALLKAQGFEYEDIRDNINQYAARLNAAIDLYNNLSIVDAFDIYDRQYSMAHNVFMDEDSEYGQVYMFIPDNYYTYSDTTKPSKAVYSPFSGFTDFGTLLTIIEGALESWRGSSDLYNINGTILRAFKDTPKQSIPYYEMHTKVDPVVDRAFLMQIMNCSIVGPLDAGNGQLDITQDPTTQNYVKWQPKAILSGANPRPIADASAQVLRLFENDITEDDNMELTRLVNFINGTNALLEDCGAEIITQIELYSYDTVTDTIKQALIDRNLLDFIKGDADLEAHLRALAFISPFRYIPCLHLMYHESESVLGDYLGIAGDVYNWMLYTKEDWKQLQFVAMQSYWKPKNMNLG